ncbi:MAG: hypothetical protein M1820_008417 [Bogoriella megaspora]|nr:MAG: hypothetical protein M1820_008417 [Bogoriella megaspora]
MANSALTPVHRFSIIGSFHNKRPSGSQCIFHQVDEFKHQPLDYLVDSIRLVEVLPSTECILHARSPNLAPLECPGDILQCRIRHVRLSNYTRPNGALRRDSEHMCLMRYFYEPRRKQSYRCLSYAWGSPGQTQSVLINGKPFNIRLNLWIFLNTVRQRKAKIERENRGISDNAAEAEDLFWIDALCIDQSSVEEKNHQVRQMSKIYSNAKQVIVWLGGETPGANLCFRSMEAIVAKCNVGAEDDIWTETVNMSKMNIVDHQRIDTTLYYSSVEGGGISKSYTGPSIDYEVLPETSQGMCGLGYWERTWVIQEVVLGHDVVIWQGSLTMPWCDFSKVWGCLENKAEHMAGNASASFLSRLKDTSLAPFMQMVEYGKTNRWGPLDKFIEINCNLKCFDVRDRVFSLLSLAKRNTQITANYHLSPLGLFLKMVKARLEDKHDCFCYFSRLLKLLNLCLVFEEPIRPTDISWPTRVEYVEVDEGVPTIFIWATWNRQNLVWDTAKST